MSVVSECPDCGLIWTDSRNPLTVPGKKNWPQKSCGCGLGNQEIRKK